MPKPIAFPTAAKVTLDAAGKPVSIEADANLPDDVRKFVEQRVATWHFSPPEQDGVTGGAVTYLRLGACALPADGGSYRLAVDLDWNGPRYTLGPELLPPDYPKNARLRRMDARLLATFVVERNGRATLEKMEYVDGGSHRGGGFEAAIRNWVGGMRFEPEQLAGHPVRTRLRVPVSFTMNKREWKDHLAESERKAASSAQCRLAAGEAPDAGMDPVALNSPVKIDPAG